MTKFDAQHVFTVTHIDPSVNFFALTADEVGRLLEMADSYKYRRPPPNAHGSRGRYFHAYLKRLMARP